MSIIDEKRRRELDKVKLNEASELIRLAEAEDFVKDCLSKWESESREEAERIYRTLEDEFPNQFSDDDFWHSASEEGFTDFFTWGHNHNFGFGFSRGGAMKTRHIEITSELISRGLMPKDLSGKSVLNIGCWSGGDALVLAAMGAKVTALEEHPKSAASAKRLFELVGADIDVVIKSLYQDDPLWMQKFDVIYCSGVLYHVTDPMLFLRICFAYLKPEGRLILETKAEPEDENFCRYLGTVEKGWNWYSPTMDCLARWLIDAGFDMQDNNFYMRPVGRLLSSSIKKDAAKIKEKAGFSRPGSWLEGKV